MLSTTISTVTAQGNGANTNWPFSFIIPTDEELVVTLTEIATGITTILDNSTYTVTGLNNPAGGSVTYPLMGSPLSTAYNLTIDRIVALVQDTDLVSQSNYDPQAIENSLDYLTMIDQQQQAQLDRCLAFPVGAIDLPPDELITAILNAGNYASQAAASAADAAASAAEIEALLPLDTVNIKDEAITSAKLATNSIIPRTIRSSALSYSPMMNGTFVPSVDANALTIAVKTLAGDDPSDDNQVLIAMRQPLPDGDYAGFTISSALSLTIPATATMGFSSGVPSRFWIVMFNNAGVPTLGVVNCRSGSNIFPLGSQGRASTTAIDTGADSAAVFYTGSALTNRVFMVLGYMEWNAGLAAAGVWDIVPTRIQLLDSMTQLPGAVVQQAVSATGVLNTGSTAIPYDNTVPQSSEGTQFLSQAITPTSLANLLEVEVLAMVGADTTEVATGAIFQDAVAAALVGMSVPVTVANVGNLKLHTVTLPGAGASTTMKFRAGVASGANNITFNGVNGTRKLGGVANSYLSVKEIQS